MLTRVSLREYSKASCVPHDLAHESQRYTRCCNLPKTSFSFPHPTRRCQVVQVEADVISAFNDFLGGQGALCINAR